MTTVYQRDTQANPRQQLVAMWDHLESRYRASVTRVELAWLTDREVGALLEHAERRRRTLAEGVDAGWWPGKGQTA